MEGETDFKFRHVSVPGFIGLVLGVLATLIDFGPNPMQVALLLAILFSPVIAHLTKTQIGWEHSFGLAIICLFEATLWFAGISYFNTVLVLIVWLWMSSSWWRLELPPFRIGVWHGFGLSFTTLAGGLLAYGLLQ
ncbi:MAG: hypothetical protein NZ737_03835 [Candidatus Poseidoniaceae archaeon]|nr:hypothetical protein [Candidatus Poseidoniaceae archaeon]